MDLSITEIIMHMELLIRSRQAVISGNSHLEFPQSLVLINLRLMANNYAILQGSRVNTFSWLCDLIIV